MSDDNKNVAKNGWSEYGRLVLKELERLNDGQDKLKDEIDKKFQELNEKMSEFKNITLETPFFSQNHCRAAKILS